MPFSSLSIKKVTYLNRVDDAMRKPRCRSNDLQDKKKTRLVQVANVNLYVGKSSLNHTIG